MTPNTVALYLVALLGCTLAVTTLGCGSSDKTAVAQDHPAPRCLPIVITPGKESLEITNKDSQPWVDVHVTINQTETSSGSTQFEATIPSIATGGTVTVSFRDTVRDDGLRFDPEKYKLLDVSVQANEGIYNLVGHCEATERQRLNDEVNQLLKDSKVVK